MANDQQLHIEKGEPFYGPERTPVDMTRPEFSGLKEVISKTSVQDGEYVWDQQSKLLTPASGGHATRT